MVPSHGRYHYAIHLICGHADWTCTSICQLCRLLPSLFGHGVIWGERVESNHF